MAKGRKPLPASLHLIKGNPSKLRFNTLQDSSRVPVEIPEPPEHLMPEALVEWNRITVELEKLGLIARIDRAALGVYCQAYARWAKVEIKLRDKGDDALVDQTPSGYQQISVLLQISTRAVEQMHKFLAEFGMTPSARSRVNISPQQDMFGDESQKPGKEKGYFT